MEKPAHCGTFSAALAVFASRWPAFQPWRLGPSANGPITLSPPDGKLRPGLHEIRFRPSRSTHQATRLRIVFDGNLAHAVQFPAVGSAGATFFLHVPRDARRVALDGAGADLEVALRRVGVTRLVVAIAARKDAPRRRAMRALLSGAPALAVDLLSAGVEAAAADYHAWIARYDTPPPDAAARVAGAIAGWASAPAFTVVMPAYNSSATLLDAAITSVVAQHYPHWRLIVTDDGSTDSAVAATLTRWAETDPRISFVRLPQNSGIAGATNAALALADKDWIAFLDHDDQLAPDALFLVAAAIHHHPSARILYTDEDKIDDANRRTEPYFKPRWNRALFHGQNYLNHLTVIHRGLVTDVGGLRAAFEGSQDYDLLLRCIERIDDEAIIHVPFVCYHWRFTDARDNFSVHHGARAHSAALRALDEHFARTGAAAHATSVAGTPYWRATWQKQNTPVSLIIPTRDRKDLLAQAIQSITSARNAYPAFDIIVADNGSTEDATLAYFREIESAGVARVVAIPGPFNFSHINNIAAAQARGAVLGFINNDVKVRNPDWLAEMVQHFSEARVAAVGAKLLYGDGRVQHAGVVTGIGGVAGHLYKRRDGADHGPFSHLVLPRDVTAVTGACMLVRAEAFRAAGGFDAKNLPVAFNDVDLCLRLRAQGRRIIWTPFAVLDHFESVSRGAEVGRQHARFEGELAYMQRRWGATLAEDPCYNPNLTLADESGGLAFPPRVRRPWADGVQ